MNSAYEHEAVLKMWAEYDNCCDYIPVGDLPEIGNLFSEFEPVN